MSAEDAVVSVLATKRLVRLIVDDTVLQPVRDRVWEVDPPARHRLGYVLTCHSCSSVWAAGAVMIARRSSIGRLICNTLAVSEAVMMIVEAAQRTDSRDFSFST